MTRSQLALAMNNLAGIDIQYFDNDYQSEKPLLDTDLALVRLPNDLYLDVVWRRELGRFVVTIFSDDFDTVVARRECVEYDDVLEAVRAMSTTSQEALCLPETTMADITYGYPFANVVRVAASGSHDTPKIGVFAGMNIGVQAIVSTHIGWWDSWRSQPTLSVPEVRLRIVSPTH